MLSNGEDSFICGRIINSRNKKPIPEANINLYTLTSKKPVNKTKTNKEGYYLINNVSPGRYYITGFKTGYYTTHDSLTINKSKFIKKNLKLINLSTNKKTKYIKMQVKEITETKAHFIKSDITCKPDYNPVELGDIYKIKVYQVSFTSDPPGIDFLYDLQCKYKYKVNGNLYYDFCNKQKQSDWIGIDKPQVTTCPGIKPEITFKTTVKFEKITDGQIHGKIRIDFTVSNLVIPTIICLKIPDTELD